MAEPSVQVGVQLGHALVQHAADLLPVKAAAGREDDELRQSLKQVWNKAQRSKFISWTSHRMASQVSQDGGLTPLSAVTPSLEVLHGLGLDDLHVLLEASNVQSSLEHLLLLQEDL